MMTYYNYEEVRHLRNVCPKLYDKTSQVGHLLMWPMHQRDRFSQVPEVYLYQMKSSKKYQMFQQFQAIQKTLSSFTVTLA